MLVGPAAQKHLLIHRHCVKKTILKANNSSRGLLTDFSITRPTVAPPAFTMLNSTVRLNTSYSNVSQDGNGLTNFAK